MLHKQEEIVHLFRLFCFRTFWCFDRTVDVGMSQNKAIVCMFMMTDTQILDVKAAVKSMRNIKAGHIYYLKACTDTHLHWAAL